MTVPEGDAPPAPPVGDGPTGTPPLATPPVEEAKGFTQEQVNRWNADAKRKGEEAALAALTQRFGGKSLEEVEAAIKQAQAAEDEKKTELDKLREQNESLKKESDAHLSEAKRDAHDARVRLYLLQAGLPKETAEDDDALARVSALVTVPVGSPVDDVKTDIAALKDKFPQLFASSESPKPAPNPSSNPSGTPRKQPLAAKPDLERGAEIAAIRNAKRGVQTPTA